MRYAPVDVPRPSPETRTPDPLIKSQGPEQTEQNINKNAQPFRGPVGFFFDNGRYMFCAGSGTNEHSRRCNDLRSALILLAAFADINIAKTDRILNSWLTNSRRSRHFTELH